MGTIKRRKPGRREGISETTLARLSCGLFPEPEEPDAFEQFIVNDREAWAVIREEVLALWIQKNPGTRPPVWWLYEAPEPARKRLGGVGTPSHEVLAYVPAFHCGIPESWVMQWESDYYGPDFKGVAIDPLSPPRYEAQAAYLERHGLLLPGEKRRLADFDFEPEVLGPEVWGDETVEVES